MTTIVRQAAGLALAAAIAAGSYGIDVDRSARTRQSAARIVIRSAPERRVALGAVHADRRSRSADRRFRSGATRRATVPTPARVVVVVPTHPVAPRTVALSAPPAQGPARRRGPCPVGRGDPSPSPRMPDSGRPPRAPRVDVEPAPHDRDREPRVDAPGPPDRDAPPLALPTPTAPTAPPSPQTPPAPQPPQAQPAPQPPPQPPQQPAPQPTPMPPSNPSMPPPSPPPTPPEETTTSPVTVPTPPTPGPPDPGAIEPLPTAPAPRPAG